MCRLPKRWPTVRPDTRMITDSNVEPIKSRNMHFISLKKLEKIPANMIPELPYSIFYAEVLALLQDPANDIIRYDGYHEEDRLRFVCVIGNALNQHGKAFSYSMLNEQGILLTSIGRHHVRAHHFEVRISEKMSLTFANLPKFEEVDRKLL